MAKHAVDPVLRQLVRRPHLIAQSRYFSELVEGNPLMSALEPSSGLLGKDYVKEAEAESDHHLHLRAAGIRGGSEVIEDPWRISLEAVDGWALRAGDAVEQDKGPFARLLGTP
jgi:hypothetical protein